MTVAKRLVDVAYQLGPCLTGYVMDFKLFPPASEGDSVAQQKQHAIRLREALTSLGPAYVKGGQQLSIRPDLIPPTVLKELQKLCDAVRPIPDEVALQMIRDELGCEDLSTIFRDAELVASASLVSAAETKHLWRSAC